MLEEEYCYSYQGVPQGRVLSPLLYNIYVAKICEGVPKRVTVLQFADDIAVYCSRGNIDLCKRLVAKAIDVIYHSLLDLGLEISSHKTVLVSFNRRGVMPGDVTLTIRNFKVDSYEVVKFLGITFDYRLYFGQQIKEFQRKCLRAMNVIKFVRGTWWGADLATLIVLYKSFVRAKLDYGLFVYLPTRKTFLENLEGIQYSAIRLALQVRISTPKNLLLAESKLVRISE